MLGWAEQVGRYTLGALAIMADMARLVAAIGGRSLLPASYNPAVRLVLVRQIYFTAVQVLPLFLVVGLAFGSVAVGALVAAIMQFELTDQAGRLVVDLLVLELAPLFTALLVALRSGAAIDAEMATMGLTGEFRTLSLFGVDRTTYLFLPRLLAGLIGVPLLTALFTGLVLASAYLFLFLFAGTEVTPYLDAVTGALSAPVAAALLAKSLLFGFLVVFIPLYSGLHPPGGLTGIPIAVLRGMMRLFLGLVAVETIILGLLWL